MNKVLLWHWTYHHMILLEDGVVLPETVAAGGADLGTQSDTS